MLKKFICPHCRVESNKIGIEQRGTLYSSYDITEEDYNREEEDFSFVSYYCMECGKDLEEEEVEHLFV